MLPFGGAFRLAERISADNLINNTVILFMTANDNKAECIKSFECGADGFFQKSIDIDIFLLKMKSYIRLKKAVESNIMSIPKNDIAIYHYAPNEVSGDYSGIKQINDGCYAILLADVSGHGVAASMLTILIKSFFDSHAIIDSKNTSPSVFLKELNNFFIDEGFDKSLFASVFYAVYNNETGYFLFSSGGSPKPLYYSNFFNKIDFLDIDGPLIGMTEESKYTETSIKLAHNDTLFLFTDGA